MTQIFTNLYITKIRKAVTEITETLRALCENLCVALW